MGYCQECGAELVLRALEGEGDVPYCETCRTFRFPTFSTAISVAVLSPEKDKILLIKQYGNGLNVLVAGYVAKGENLEETLRREIREEIGIGVSGLVYMQSRYFEPTNTLMCNFYCTAETDNLHFAIGEVDEAGWYTPEEALRVIKPNSLAQFFLRAIVARLFPHVKEDVQ